MGKMQSFKVKKLLIEWVIQWNNDIIFTGLESVWWKTKKLNFPTSTEETNYIQTIYTMTFSFFDHLNKLFSLHLSLGFMNDADEKFRSIITFQKVCSFFCWT